MEPDKNVVPNGTRQQTSSSVVEEKKRGRLFSIQNVGGSITVIFQLALLAFGVRHLRNIIAKRRKNIQAGSGNGSPGFAQISSSALKMLIRLDPTPFQLIDIRSRDEAQENPLLFENILNIPATELFGALQLVPTAWEHRFGSSRQPQKREVLVILSSDVQKAELAASTAASLGYSRCCTLKGGINSLLEEYEPESPTAKRISRDGLAMLLSHHHSPRPSPNVFESMDPEETVPENPQRIPVLLDVRRYDERTLFGGIPHAKHIPVDQLAVALASDKTVWEKKYRFPKPDEATPVIFQCRTNKRAQWAAQLASDAGYTNCFVYTEGAFGWRLHPSVMAYSSYEEGDSPPEPTQFSVETIDKSAAERELKALGLIP